MTQDERDLFEEKIKGIATLINARFTVVDEKLEQIHAEAKRTNSRVTHLEEYKEMVNTTILPNRVTPEKLNCLVEDCHKKIEGIEKKFEDMAFFLRHPKLFIAILVTIVILTLGTFLENNPLKVFDKTPTPTQTEIVK